MRPTQGALRLAATTTSRAPRLTPSHLIKRPAVSSTVTQPSPHHHPFSTSTPRHTTPTPIPNHPLPSGLAHLRSRRILSLTGPDTAKFLQGLITANITPGHATPNPAPEHIRTDAGFYAAFLNAQGRILHDVFVYQDWRGSLAGAAAGDVEGGAWLVEVDAGEAKALQAHLRRYKLRAKVQVRLLEEGEVGVWQAWDDTKSSNSAPEASASVITIPDPRAPNLGYRILTFSSTPPSIPLDLDQVPETAYHLRRYLHGVPEGAAELTPGSALPHESNLDLMGVTTGTGIGGAIDFRKGCYVGQELTIRTEHRGVVRKRVLPVLLYPDDNTPLSSSPSPPAGSADIGAYYRPSITNSPASNDTTEALTAATIPPGTSIKRLAKSGRSAGKWLHGIGNVGLALCRLETMTDVVLPGEAAGTGFVEGDEFYVGLGDGDAEGGEGGNEGSRVRVKAFVPGWLRSGLEGKVGGLGH